MIVPFNLNSVPALVALVINLALFITLLLYQQRERQPVHRIFLFILAQFICWDLSELMLFNSHAYPAALFWARCVMTATAFLGGATVHLALLFPSPGALFRRRWLLPLLYLPAVLTVSAAWGGDALIASVGPRIWAPFDIRYNWAFSAYVAYKILYFSLALFIMWRTARSAERVRVRWQARLIFFVTLVPMSIGALTNLLLPLAGVFVFPLAATLATIASVGVAYAMVRYRLTAVSPRTAAELLISLVPGSVLLLDEHYRIRFLNTVAEEYLGYRSAELMGKHINTVLAGEARRQGLVWGRPGDQRTQIPVTFRTGDGREVTALFCGTMIVDAENDVVGFSLQGGAR